MAKINYILNDRSYIIIRDRIGSILLDELKNQFAMSYDSTLDAKIYTDRSRPVQPNETPLVNVTLPEGSYDNQTVIKSDGTFTFEIDCFFSNGSDGTEGGDVASRKKATKLMSACQSILENPIYIKLDFEGPFIMSSHVTNFQIGTIDRDDASSVAVATFNLVVRASQQEPTGLGVAIAGSSTIANIDGGPERLIYEGDATPIPPNPNPPCSIYNTDNQLLGSGESGGTFIVPDSSYQIVDENGNVIYSGDIPATDDLIQVISSSEVTNSNGDILAEILSQQNYEVSDSTAIVKNSEGTTQSTTSILAEGTETITANDALVGLLNSDGTVIGGDSFPSGTANNITAPDATIKNSLGTTLDSAPSGADTVLPDIPNIDSDGATVNTPAQVPFVCTPCVNDVPQVWADMFEGRVLFDGGTFEDKTNLVTTFTDNYELCNDASLVLTPSAYKTNTVYAFKPFDGSGDGLFTRAGAATRIDSSGNPEVMPANICRIDYSNGYATILLEDAVDYAYGFGGVDTFNSEEGVLFVEMQALVNDSTRRDISIGNGSVQNVIILRFNAASNDIQAYIEVGNVIYANMTNNTHTITDMNKVAFKWKENDFALWINGVEVATDSSGITFPANTLDRLNFSFASGGLNKMDGKVKCLAVFKEALTDLELQTLTTI